MNWSLILSILAFLLALVAAVQAIASRGRVKEKIAGIHTPNGLREIALQCTKGDSIILTTEQHLTKVQAEGFRACADGVAAEAGVRLILVAGGLKPSAVIKGEKVDVPDLGRLIDTLDESITRRRAEQTPGKNTIFSADNVAAATGPGGMEGPPGSVFDPVTGQFLVPPPQHPASPADGRSGSSATLGGGP